MHAKLSLHQVSKSYEQENGLILTIFDTISYDFLQGHRYAIIGASGSGKSTCIHLLSGVDSPTSGNVFFSGQSVALFSAYQMSLFFQKNISLVFQQAALFAELTVLENVMIKAILAGTVTNKSYDRAYELLQEVGLADFASAYPQTLSGGQQQRVAILRAIFVVPQFLLLDEPTGNLDEQNSKLVVDLLLEYQKKYGMCLIMSTHSYQIAEQMETIIKVENKKLSIVSI